MRVGSIELEPPPCQDQSTKALQDVLDREPEDDREQDREVVKGVHDTKLPGKLSLQTAAIVRSTAATESSVMEMRSCFMIFRALVLVWIGGSLPVTPHPFKKPVHAFTTS